METVKTRDKAAVESAAQIWAHATAKRDDNPASDSSYDEALPLIEEAIEHSDRSFLLVINDPDCDEDSQMMAFAAVEPSRGADSEIGEIRYLGVAPGHWGEGWARRLLVAVPDAMRENDFTSGELWVYADNIRAIFVYEAMGWRGTDETRRHPQTDRVEQKFVLKLA